MDSEDPRSRRDSDVRILVCGDYLPLLRWIQEILNQSALQTRICTRLIGCLDEIQAWRPDLVLIHRGHPGLSHLLEAESCPCHHPGLF